MNQELRENKQICRAFLQEHYTDERLAMLLAHAEDGKLSYFSCCCFIGTATSDHALRGHSVLIEIAAALPRGAPDFVFPKHYFAAKNLRGAEDAEEAFFDLGDDAAERRAEILGIIRKEIRRRDRQAAQTELESLVEETRSE